MSIRKSVSIWLAMRRRDLPGTVFILIVLAAVVVGIAWYGRQTGEHLADPKWPCFYGPKGVACKSQPQ